MEQELATGLGEGQIAEFVEDDEVHAGEMIGESALPTVAGLSLEPVDEIDHVVEPTAGAGADAASGDGDGEMRLAGAGRSSDILPGIRTPEAGSSTHFTRGVARRPLLFDASVSKARRSSS